MMRLGEWGVWESPVHVGHFGGTFKHLTVRTKPVKRKHTQEDKKAGGIKFDTFGGTSQ